MGRFAVAAISYVDFPVVMGVVFVASFVFVLVNLAVDLLYTVIDPRIRY
jgi:peptide/nickel transport system permease protein